MINYLVPLLATVLLYFGAMLHMRMEIPNRPLLFCSQLGAILYLSCHIIILVGGVATAIWSLLANGWLYTLGLLVGGRLVGPLLLRAISSLPSGILLIASAAVQFLFTVILLRANSDATM